MKRWPLALACLALSGCLSPLGMLSGGPNVAANGQAGQTNSQTLGQSETTQQSVTRSQVGTVHQSRDTVSAGAIQQVRVQQTPPWLIIAFAVALFLDSPLRWPGEIINAFRRDRR